MNLHLDEFDGLALRANKTCVAPSLSFFVGLDVSVVSRNL
jgi:hypothetical protein